MKTTKDTLQEVFRTVFGDPSIVLDERQSAKDFEDWDSMQHINLIIAAEKAFKIKFPTAAIARLKQPGQNIGSFIQLIDGQIVAQPSRL